MVPWKAHVKHLDADDAPVSINDKVLDEIAREQMRCDQQGCTLELWFA